MPQGPATPAGEPLPGLRELPANLGESTLPICALALHCGSAEQFERARERLQRRAGLRSRGLFRVLDVTPNPQICTVFFAAEFAEGNALAQPWSEETLMQLFGQGLEALVDLQQLRDCHGDLRPEHLALAGHSPRLKLVERFTDPADPLQRQMIVLAEGKPPYLPVDVWSALVGGRSPVAGNPLRLDVFALGLIFLERMFGRSRLQPFYLPWGGAPGTSMRELFKELIAGCEAYRLRVFLGFLRDCVMRDCAEEVLLPAEAAQILFDIDVLRPLWIAELLPLPVALPPQKDGAASSLARRLIAGGEGRPIQPSESYSRILSGSGFNESELPSAGFGRTSPPSLLASAGQPSAWSREPQPGTPLGESGPHWSISGEAGKPRPFQRKSPGFTELLERFEEISDISPVFRPPDRSDKEGRKLILADTFRFQRRSSREKKAASDLPPQLNPTPPFVYFAQPSRSASQDTPAGQRKDKPRATDWALPPPPFRPKTLAFERGTETSFPAATNGFQQRLSTAPTAVNVHYVEDRVFAAPTTQPPADLFAGFARSHSRESNHYRTQSGSGFTPSIDKLYPSSTFINAEPPLLAVKRIPLTVKSKLLAEPISHSRLSAFKANVPLTSTRQSVGAVPRPAFADTEHRLNFSSHYAPKSGYIREAGPVPWPLNFHNSQAFPGRTFRGFIPGPGLSVPCFSLVDIAPFRPPLENLSAHSGQRYATAKF